MFGLHLLRILADHELVMADSPTLSKEDSDVVMQLYFDVRNFCMVLDWLDDKYQICLDYDSERNFRIKLQCMDPSERLRKVMERGKSAVLFSATMLPIRYYKEQLSGDTDDVAVYAKSSFLPEQRKILIAKDATTKYTRRGPDEYEKIARYIETFVSARQGNYLIFFPSYLFMSEVTARLNTTGQQRLMIQQSNMREREKEEFFSYAEEVRTNYNKKLLYRDEEGFYHYRDWSRRDQGIVSTQTVQALPLYWGMVPPGAKYDIVQELRRQLEEKDHFVAGEVGLPYVIQAAAQNGMSDLVAAYATRETHPSYYAFLKDGETTLGEYWEENPRSHCHDMMGHIVEWIYNGMAGIEPVAPGFREVKLHPWLPEDMDSFTCTYKIGADRDGTIRVEAWRDEDGDPRFRYSLPYWVNVVSSKYPLE